MTLHLSVRERLHALEALLRETDHWQDNAPEAALLPAISLSVWTRLNRWSGCSGS
jgi:uncharacterized protein YqcC (DUF446 family)